MCKIPKYIAMSEKRNKILFLDQLETLKDRSHKYQALDMDDRFENKKASGVYMDLEDITNEGKYRQVLLNTFPSVDCLY